MYTRCNALKRIVQNLITPTSYNRFIRFQSSATRIAGSTLQNSKQKTNVFYFEKSSLVNFSASTTNRYNSEDVFLDLTTDYNRKRFVQSDLIRNAIQNINNNISEKLSLLILTAAARCVHHVTPEKRVELLEEVKY